MSTSTRSTISRREALIGLAALFTGCATSPNQSRLITDVWAGSDDADNASSARLRSRPETPKEKPLASGQHQIDVEKDRTAIAYIPRGYNPAKPAAFMLLLHGATLNAEGPIRSLQPFADEAQIILLSPKSAAYTWDLSISGFGQDIEFVDKCLAYMFDRHLIDAKRMAIGGFSDGASYALSVGVANGDLFGHVVAFSPGYMAPVTETGKPRIFISHGTKDEILPIDRCGRRLAAELKQKNYDVTFKEFDGPHTVPRDIAKEAVTWFRN